MMEDLLDYFDLMSPIQTRAVLQVWRMSHDDQPSAIAAMPSEQQRQLLIANCPEEIYLSLSYYGKRLRAGQLTAVGSDFFRPSVGDGEREVYLDYFAGCEKVENLPIMVFQIDPASGIRDLNELRLDDHADRVPAVFRGVTEQLRRLEAIRGCFDVEHQLALYRQFRTLTDTTRN